MDDVSDPAAAHAPVATGGYGSVARRGRRRQAATEAAILRATIELLTESGVGGRQAGNQAATGPMAASRPASAHPAR